MTIACFIFLIVNGTAVATVEDIHTPATRYVGAAGGGNYTTIQAAIDSSSSGDTIIVYPGTYTEVIDVDVESLTIRSFSGNPEDTIVRTLSPSHNFKVIANDVTISGFNITGEGYYTGVFITGVSGANIINNKFSGNDCAIQMQSSSGCNLINNTVSGSTSYGFHLLSSSNCILANNTVSNTSYEGIYLSESDNCTLDNNTVSDTSDDGIYLYYSSSCNLTGNTVSNNDGKGIYLYYSSSCNFTDNIVSNSGYDGIYLYYSSSCNLTGNTISDTDDGIDLEYSSSCNLSGNTISKTSDDGIDMYESGSSILTNNTVSDAYYGISLGYSSECVLRNNTASSGIYGIRLWDIENCTLTGNIMSGNWYNFNLESSYYNDFDNATGNIIDTSNLVDGKAVYYLEGEPNPTIGRDAGVIYCINCGEVEIKDFVLQNNSYAVLLYNTSSELQNNTINNTEFGVTVLSSQDVRLSDSRIENSLAGIVFEGDTNITLTDNTIQNSTYGIVTFDSENCTLTGNYIQNATEEYSYYTSVNSKLVRGEENTLTKKNSLINSNLVQSTRSYGYGIYSEDCQDLKLENNVIDRADLAGIYLMGCQNVGLVRNSVRDIGDIMSYAYDSSSAELLDNTVQNATEEYSYYNSANSKLVRNEENTLIRENTLINSNLVQSRKPYGYGIYSEDCQDLKLENNIVDQADFAGIYLMGCQNVGLVRNSIRNIGYMGIFSYDSSSVELLENTVQNITGETQLYATENSPLVSSPLVSSPLVSSPLVSSPLVSGIFGPSCGVFIAFSQDIRFEGNTVEDCYNASGIYLYELGNVTLESNTIKNCMIGLIDFMNDNCSVRDCSLNNCTYAGIVILNFDKVPGTGYTVAGCTVDGSEIGMLVTGEGTVAGNTLSENSYGMVLYNVDNSLIYGNTMVRNSLAGLVIESEENDLVTASGLVGSLEGPESGNNTIYNNYFNNVNNTLISSEADNSWNTSKIAGESIVGGPYLGGNYWANPNGTGFSENCTDADKDGIADSSYEIVNGTFDYLPLTTIPSTPTKHKSSANYIPSRGESTGVKGTDSSQKRVVAGTEASFRFNNPVSGILELSFTSQQYSGNVVARIEVLGDGSSGEKPEGEVYQLMNILVGNERFESGTNIKRADINFRVSRSWVEENNIDVSTITMNRFHDEEWNALSTEKTGEDEEFYYFSAKTPGLSRYAITGDKLGTEIITPAEVKETGTVTGEEQTGDENKSTPGFESTFSILGVLVSGFFAKKRVLK